MELEYYSLLITNHSNDCHSDAKITDITEAWVISLDEFLSSILTDDDSQETIKCIFPPCIISAMNSWLAMHSDRYIVFFLFFFSFPKCLYIMPVEKTVFRFTFFFFSLEDITLQRWSCQGRKCRGVELHTTFCLLKKLIVFVFSCFPKDLIHVHIMWISESYHTRTHVVCIWLASEQASSLWRG